MGDITIRRLDDLDKVAWSELWHGYNEFYERKVEQTVTNRVWAALQKGTGEPFGFAAEINGNVVGFTHYFFLQSTSDLGPRCYMQDLFASPTVRGRGIGHALINAVYTHADEMQAAQTYWLTTDTNKTAQKLYDRVATKTPFVKYKR